MEQDGEKRTQSVIYFFKKRICRVRFHHHREILKVWRDSFSNKSSTRYDLFLAPGTSSGRPIGTATRLTTASGVSAKLSLI